MFNHENFSIGGIETLETVYQQLNRTMWQLIMQETTGEGNILFITVGRPSLSSEVICTYPTIYKKEAHTRMLAIGQYL